MERRPLVEIAGVLHELPAGDTIPEQPAQGVVGLAPVVELPGVCAITDCEDWPELVMEYDEDGDLDLVVAEVS